MVAANDCQRLVPFGVRRLVAPFFSCLSSTAFWLTFGGLLAGWAVPLAAQVSAPENKPAAKPFDPYGDFEKSLVFFPSRFPQGNWHPADLQFEDAWFAAVDGTRLYGWYLPQPSPRAVALYCHGNAGNVAEWADAGRVLHDRVGLALLIFDYRGYGRSEGAPSEAGVVADARAARAWLAQRTGVPEGRIVLMGRSLGGGVAVHLAANDGARALVLESTFTSLPDVGKAHYPFLPVRILMQTRLDSLSKIGRYHGPLLQSHGTADRLIPYANGRRLYDAASPPKRFYPIVGGDHNDPQPPAYYELLAAFLDDLNRQEASPR